MTGEAAEVDPSIAELLVARAEDDHLGLRFEDRQWTWREVVTASAERASLIRSLDDGGPLHIGVLLGNVPEYLFWLGAAALAGAVVVGINPTRRGEALAGDVRRTDCRLLVTDADGAALLDGLDLGVAPDRVLRADLPDYDELVRAHRGADPRQVVASAAPVPEDLYLLLFTSGTTGAPKAVRCTQGRLAAIAVRSAGAYGFDRSDVAYCTMPLFHGNALMVLWGPALAVGATVALARRFTASGFGSDIRRYGATTFTYVGKALAYILATPPEPDDATTTLRRGFGTEASVADFAAFEQRFGCVLTEGYGSSEGGVAISRTPDTPAGSLGRPSEDVVIMDPEALTVCPAARFDAAGRLTNGDAAVGEIVNRSGPGRFEGYYADEEATAARTAARLVLDGRPGLPGRGRVLLLRRPTGGLDAGRLGEPERRAHRAGAGPLRAGGHRGGVLGARPAVGRPGDGRAGAVARPGVRARGVRLVPRRPGRSRDQVGPVLRAGGRRAAPDGQRQGDQAAPSRRRLVAGG